MKRKKEIPRSTRPLSRSKGLKRSPKTRAIIDKQASEAWAKGARSKPCAICGGLKVQGHHVITQQELRKAAKRLGLEFERLRWDKRNRLSLCPRCHARHHDASRRITFAVLEEHCPKVFQFARELELGWYLDRYYGDLEVQFDALSRAALAPAPEDTA